MTAESAPVIKPASLPKYIAVITTVAVTGLKPGIGAKINRPITDIATITAITVLEMKKKRDAGKHRYA